MQITLVWFQDLQRFGEKKREKNVIDNQRDTICFQELVSICENGNALIQMDTCPSEAVTVNAQPRSAGNSVTPVPASELQQSLPYITTHASSPELCPFMPLHSAASRH